MAIKEKVTHEDLILYEIISNPVLFAEFINNYDRSDKEEKFELTDYQKEFMLDFSSYEVLCCSRAVGKTVSLVNLITWMLVYNVFPSEYIVYFVPGKAQLDPVWNGLIRIFRTNGFLKNFIAPNGGFNSSDFRLTLLSQATLLCRIAGQSGTGVNAIGLHTPFVIIDEAGYFPWPTFMEMQPIVNTFTPGYRMLVSGVPTGVRENNVLYHCDQENSSYSKHRVNSFRNPRFTEKDKKFAIDQYGGEDSEEYIHSVLGQHGKPVFALFDRTLMEIGTYPVYKLHMSGLEMGDEISAYVNRIQAFPGLSDRGSKCLIGIDLGYTEPTAIVIMYLDSLHRIKFHGRIQLNKVSYPIQEKLIDLLDTKFDPFTIGIDKGNVGVSVIQRLTDSNEYAHKNYAKKIVPVDFSSSIVLGINTEGEEIKSKTKPFATSVLQEYSNNHKIVFSSTDLEMITELERMTYTKTVSGEIVYRTLTTLGGKKGEDHFTSALLCAGMAYYLTNEYLLSNKKKKPFGFSWLGN